MTDHKLTRRAGSPGTLFASSICLGMALQLAACAGTDVLDIDTETKTTLAEMYGGSQTGIAGMGGTMNGGGGSPMGGDGGSAVANAGSDSGGSDTGGSDTGGSDMGGSDTGGSGGGESCDGFAVLKASCAGVCHVTGGSFGTLTAFANDESQIDDIIGETSAMAGDACGPLIDPSSPTNSLIYRKAAATQGSCGQPMPLGDSDGLDQDDLDCLETWIGSL
jgi:hypothetical protein